MQKAKVILIGMARPGFDTDLALQIYDQAISVLQSLSSKLMHPKKMATDPDEVEQIIQEFAAEKVDVLVVLFSTFVDGRFVEQITRVSNLPILLWSVPEPSTHGRLRLNSLTGLNSAAYILTRLERRYEYVYGPANELTSRLIERWLKVFAVAQQLKSAKIGVIGDYPPGFFASAADALDLERRIGPQLIKLDLEMLFNKAVSVPESSCLALIEDYKEAVSGIDDLDAEQFHKSVRFTIALQDQAKALKLDALAVRCAPEFINAYGGAACAALGELNDLGIPTSCEADILGAVSMLMQHEFTGKVVFLGDLVHANEERNTFTFWHCGSGARSLASPKTGPVAGVQPNRNLAYAFNHRLKAGPVTIARLGQTKEGYRMLIAQGEALDDIENYWGTSVEVRLSQPVMELLDVIIKSGFEFHYSIVWEDITKELEALCSWLDIPITVL